MIENDGNIDCKATTPADATPASPASVASRGGGPAVEKEYPLLPSSLRRFGRRFFSNRIVIASFLVLCAFLIVGFSAPFLPVEPYQTEFANRLQSPSLVHVMGTDHMGRDILSRVIMGSTVALQIALVSVVMGLVVGGLLGLVAGFLSGSRVDGLIMRCMDIVLAFPWLLLVIAVIAILGPSITNVMIAIGITLIPEYARLVRSIAIATCGKEFVQAATALGATPTREMLVHVMPHCIPQIIVYSTIKLGRAILAEASVSYLGLGVQPPHPSWGSMIAIGQDYLLSSPHMSLIPGLVVVIVVMSLNVIGDGLRDALDPKYAAWR